jgi:hypothetical protein
MFLILSSGVVRAIKTKLSAISNQLSAWTFSFLIPSAIGTAQPVLAES